MNKQSMSKLEDEYLEGSMPEVYQLIEQIAKKLMKFKERTMRETNLTPAQYCVLSLLWEKDGSPFKDLSSACFCSPATLTGIVDTLEKKELVKREPNPNDRRSLLLRLTAKGRSLEDTAPVMEKIFGSCCVGLNNDELQILSALLKKLNESLPF